MTIETTLSCEQLGERLAALHQASLELVQDISIDSLLQRIAQWIHREGHGRLSSCGPQVFPRQFYRLGLVVTAFPAWVVLR